MADRSVRFASVLLTAFNRFTLSRFSATGGADPNRSELSKNLDFFFRTLDELIFIHFPEVIPLDHPRFWLGKKASTINFSTGSAPELSTSIEID